MSNTIDITPDRDQVPQLSEPFRFKLARFLIKHLGRFCMVDNENLHRVYFKRWTNQERRRRMQFKEAKFWERAALELDEPQRNAPKWPLVTFAGYIFLTCYVFVLLVLQIKYDYLSFRLELALEAQAELASAHDEASLSPLQLLWAEFSVEKRLEYELEVARIERLFGVLGNPYRNFRFGASTFFLLILSLNYLTYIHVQIINNYLDPYDFCLVQLCLEEQFEVASCDSLVKYELEKVINSSRNYLAYTICLSLSHEKRDRNISMPEEMVFALETNIMSLEDVYRFCSLLFGPKNRLAKQASDHERLVEFASRFEREKLLVPLNRQPEQVETIMDQFNKVCVTNTIYSFIVDMLILELIPALTNYPLHYSDHADIVSRVLLFIYVQYNVITTSYHLALFLAHSADQRNYLSALVGHICKSIKSNEAIYARLVELYQATGQVEETLSLIMNETLLLTFLRYKVFLAQLSRVKSTSRLVISMALFTMFISPILTRLFIFYNKNNNFIWVGAILFSLSLVIFGDCLIVPICYFHHRGQVLYKTMWSFLAHSIDLQAQFEDMKFAGGIYFEQTINLIRRELDHPQELIQNFSARSLGFTATFPNLVRVHFYYSVLILSLYFQVDTWKNLLGHQLDDPLGLYKL